MRAVITRVSSASVSVNGKEVSSISKGFLVLLGVSAEDTEMEADKIADRICGLRVFEDENGKMNLSPEKAGAEILMVSQFTLYADCSSRRPSFTKAAPSELARPLYERCVEKCRQRGFKVECGIFGAEMMVSSVNDGPVTLLLDTAEL
ncbi:MAG: D-tyrosyl-tRNA(Tyr) deacylase [Clostridiales bacterium]|nr:D-tyrosyl-tRNA(Tyr) deacylase [Clostridiales bacterium]